MQSGPRCLSPYTELVPIGVREHEPRLIELLTGVRSETCRPQLFKAMDLLKKVPDEHVEMHPVLHRFSFGNLLKSERDTVAAQRDVASPDLTFHI